MGLKRGITYTKKKVMFVLEEIVREDIRSRDVYSSPARAEEGFEKRAVLEFLHWFADKALPETLDVPYEYDDLQDDYPQDAATAIVDGKGWAASRLRKEAGAAEDDDNVVLLDGKSWGSSRSRREESREMNDAAADDDDGEVVDFAPRD